MLPHHAHHDPHHDLRRTAHHQRQDQRDAHDRRLREEDLLRTAQRQEVDEQVRLRHLAEDEERRRRRVLDRAASRLRVETYRTRADPAREPHLALAREEHDRAERLWREADDARRQWPSRWPW